MAMSRVSRRLERLWGMLARGARTPQGALNFGKVLSEALQLLRMRRRVSTEAKKK
jgi:hypothetical protein